MIAHDALCEAWWGERAHRMARFRRLRTIEDAGITLGAQTVIVRKSVDRWGATGLAIDGDERRILALLATAYWRPVGPVAIRQIKRASHALSRGNKTLAAMLLAQAGLQKLNEDERIAFRLFAAEKLLDAGVVPRALMKGLGLDPWPLDALRAYNPDEPRDARGRWTDGGQWTSEGDDTGVNATSAAHGANHEVIGIPPLIVAQDAPTPGQTPLRLLHPESTYQTDPKAARSWDFWSWQSTEDIIASLHPGQSNTPLLVKPDGTVMDGNTRVQILRGRGIDVEALPRQMYIPIPPSAGGLTMEEE